MLCIPGVLTAAALDRGLDKVSAERVYCGCIPGVRFKQKHRDGTYLLVECPVCGRTLSTEENKTKHLNLAALYPRTPPRDLKLVDLPFRMSFFPNLPGGSEDYQVQLVSSTEEETTEKERVMNARPTSDKSKDPREVKRDDKD